MGFNDWRKSSCSDFVAFSGSNGWPLVSRLVCQHKVVRDLSNISSTEREVRDVLLIRQGFSVLKYYEEASFIIKEINCIFMLC